ncbi:AAA family ATPase [Jatrophihabitans endophyticus]|uniref:AAA family ATPase n=1 Tax=Jatrophihabitans endophyticus TaxID=1206085 RepID=UPI001A09F3CA|nr:AAA family ATPase [Jatrophihabitans endophyticus]MBE7189418.1 AAA family ATPase [Jatrophihabitans endophyticus]
MTRVLVTGMSGTGKSTLLVELARRGHRTIDTDHGGWHRADGGWDEPRMSALLAEHSDLVVSGTADNQGRFYDRFAHVVLLSAPLPVLLDRVTARDNPYGRTTADRDEIAHYVETVEPLLRRGATVELDACRSPLELADAVDALLDANGTGAARD